MNNPKEPRLPPKLSLKMVSIELGHSHWPEEEQLDAILQFQQEGLILKSRMSVETYAQEAYLEMEQENYGDDGSGQPQLSKANSAGESRFMSFSRYTLGPASSRGENIEIDSLIYQDIEYRILDENGYYDGSLCLALHNIYIDRADLKSFNSDKSYEDTPSYADDTSPHYAPELALAVQCHKLFIEEWKGNSNWAVERRLLEGNKEYLTTDGKNLTARAKRIRAAIGNGRQIKGKPKK